ncbi:MAG: NAD-dependent epimerase/dehydratase family protein [Bacteroidota bacterium]
MNTSLHTVLGAAGSIGQATIQALQTRGFAIRAVSRSTALPNVSNHKADLLDLAQAREAIAGATYVYICVGLPYKTEIWARDWEILMHNVITACSENNARIIYLDNIYMYGPTPLQVPITESHPQSPTSIKGKARKRTTDMLLQAIAAGKVNGLIGRAPDIYGPKAVNSSLYISVLERMLAGKGPQLLAPLDIPHCYSSTTDIGKALVDLALAEDTYGQVWHLPTGPLTNNAEMIALLNAELGTQLKASVLPNFMRKFLSLFIPPLKEIGEMLYQVQDPYDFSDAKFRTRFPDFKVSTYEEGIKAMVASFRENPELKSNL